MAAAGAGIAAGAILLALAVDWSGLALGAFYVLAGLFAISLSCWAVRVSRRIPPKASAGTFASRAGIVFAFAQFAVQAALLILLLAWLVALAFGAAIDSALFEALVLTCFTSIVTRCLGLGILNLALAIEEPRGEPTTPYWEHEREP
jgi:hypothetical protein